MTEFSKARARSVVKISARLLDNLLCCEVGVTRPYKCYVQGSECSVRAHIGICSPTTNDSKEFITLTPCLCAYQLSISLQKQTSCCALNIKEPEPMLSTLSFSGTGLMSLGNIAMGVALLLSLALLHAVATYFIDPFDLRKYPAPSCAAFTNLWTFYHSRRLRRSRAILDAHQKLGPFVRIQPRHISFADPRAIKDIYGHQSTIIKDTFYETISGGAHENIVSTRDREEHARKRRYVANVFSQRNVVCMEPLVAGKVRLLLDRLDQASEVGEVIDLREWLNLFTFDVISSMAFSNDTALLRKGKSELLAESEDGKTIYTVDPIRCFQNSTIHVASIGQWPRLLRITKPLTKWFPYSRCGDKFNDVCVRQLRQRLQTHQGTAEEGGPIFHDFCQALLTDSKGKPRNLPFGELVQEAAVFLSAGSDTTASAMTNTIYLLLKHPNALKSLRDELQESLAVAGDIEGLRKQHGVFPYAVVSPLKYLRACLDEGLRHLPPTSIGLLRQTPPEGARIAGQWIKGGVTVSAPTYTIQHDERLFSDPWSFRPERWISGSDEEKQNLKDYVFPFSLGRNACIGRNIAFLEQFVVISTLLHRYDFQFAEEGFELAVLERINANPGPMPVKVSRRRAWQPGME